jgi:hypothetical protein
MLVYVDARAHFNRYRENRVKDEKDHEAAKH